MWHECIVCATKTREHVTVLGVFEQVPLCGPRCQRKFLSDPLAYFDLLLAREEQDGPPARP